MTVLETVSRKYGEFERYNEREIKKIALPIMNTEFTVTGRLISGLVGFTVIILVLSMSFSYAASNTNSTTIGGMSAYLAQLNMTQEQILSGNGFLDEEQTLTFDIMQDSAGSDLKGIRNMCMISVSFYFVSPSPLDQTAPTVSISINGTGSNESYADTQTSYEHQWQYDYITNERANSGNVTMSADSDEDFIFKLEIDGEYIFVEVVYEDSNEILPGLEDDTLDYEIEITMTTWSIEKINEVQTV